MKNELTNKENAFEVVSFQFNSDVSFDEQKSCMDKINDIVKDYNGLISRQYYFSKEKNSWIDFAIWEDLKSAKAASEQIMNNPQAGALFSKMNQETMMFSHYELIGNI